MATQLRGGGLIMPNKRIIEARKALSDVTGCKAPANIMARIFNECTTGADWMGSSLKDMRSELAKIAHGETAMLQDEKWDFKKLSRLASGATVVHNTNREIARKNWETFWKEAL